MIIRQLINPTDYEIDRIAKAWRDEWIAQEDGWSLEETCHYVKNLCQPDKLPIMVVAEENNEIVGAVAIALNDLNVRPDLYPDVINLYVWPEHRNKGIATALLEKSCEIAFAKAEWCRRIYLYTELDDFYDRLDWTYAGKIDTVHLEPRMQNLYYMERPNE